MAGQTTTDRPPAQPQPPLLGNPLGNVTQGLNIALHAAPELRSRPNLAVAAAQSSHPHVYAQVLAHASNLAALHQAAHDVAASKGGMDVLHRQLAKASSRYAKATGQSFWASLGGDIVHPLEAAGNALAHGATAALNAVPDLHLGNRVNELGSEVGHAADALGHGLVHINPLGGVASNLQAAGSQPTKVLMPHTTVSAGTAVHSVANVMNAPLNEVLHQYRYLHDVEARHGMGAAALAGMGLLAGGIAGGIAAGPEGIVLGAEGAEGIEARILFHDSWQRTANGNTYVDPHTGQPVSPGRDLASGLFGLKPGSAPYNVLSGVGDAVGDMVLDPLSQAGGLVGRARSLEGAPGLLGQRFSGLGVTADNIDQVYSQYSSVRNAFQDLAGKSAADIQIADPRLAPIATQLSRARSGEDVLGIFRDALRAGDLTGGMRAPTLTLTRQALTDAVSNLKQWSGVVVAPGEDPTGVLAATKQTSLVKRAVDRVIASQERMPEDWDPELKAFSGKSLDLMGDTAARSLYLMLRQGESDATARATVAQFVATQNPGERMVIWHKAISDLLLARAAKASMHGTVKSSEAIFGDAQILDHLQNAAVRLSPEANLGGTYGSDTLGHDISPVVTDDGKSFGAAITANQVGRVTVPSFDEVRRAAQVLGGGVSVLGRLDDFFYDAVTQRLFKRAVLLSLSFAEHIVGGEMLQSALRVGPTNMGKSIVADVAARLGVHLESEADEAGLIARLAHGILSVPGVRQTAEGLVRVEAKLDPERFAVASALLMRHGDYGQMFLPDGVSAGHHFAGEVKSVESWRDVLANFRSRTPSKRFTDTFGLWGHDPADEGHRWASWLNEVASDPASRQAAAAYLDAVNGGADVLAAKTAASRAATEWLDAQPESYLRNFVRHFHLSQQGRDLGLTPHQDWGRVITENMLGATSTDLNGLDGELLRRVADDDRFAAAELADREDSPVRIKGRHVEHYVSGRLERIATAGHRKILSPFINALSRDPTYIEEVTRQMKALQPLMDGGMGFDEAMNVAETRAVQHMVRYVHNLNERTQFSEMARNVAPFFFAQQQAYKRLFRLAAENPGAIRRYQLGLQAFADFGVHHTNAQGLPVVTYPGIGSMTTGMLQGFGALGLAPTAPVPIVWQGSLSSANVIAPFSEGSGSFRPDLGPLVSIPLAGLQVLFPELAKAGIAPGAMQKAESAVAAAEGPILANESTPNRMWSLFVPNTFVQRMMEGLDTGLLNTYYANATHQMIAVLDMEQQRALDRWIAGGQQGPKPQIIPDPSAEKSGALTPAQQVFRDRVVHGTRILAIMKAFVGLVTPLSPQLNLDKLGLTADVQADIKKYGLGPGLDHFRANHPDASAYTVFSSEAASGGANLPATAPAMHWVDTHQGLIARHPDAALYLMPAADSKGPFDLAAYNQQLESGLRVKRTNDQFLQAVYKANGDQLYYGVVRPYYEAARVMASHPEMSEAQAKAWAADPKNAAALQALPTPKALSTWFTATIAALEAQNPTWGAQFEASSGNARIVAQQALGELRQAVKDPDAPKDQRTADIKWLIDQYDQVAQALPVGDSSYASTQQIAVQKGWREYLDEISASRPDLSNVIQSVFYDLGAPTVTGGSNG